MRGIAAAALGTPAIIGTAHAIDAGPVAIHGAVSATSAYSDRYNYLGETKDSLDLNIVELTLNGVHRFESGLRLGAQLYAYEISGYNDLALDFATLDYSFREWLGVRVGRNKTTRGLYGDSQDVDVIRPFAFLPLDVYPKTMRPLNAAYDGAGVYGTVSLKGAGSLDYQVNYGWIPQPDANAPYLLDINETGPARNSSTKPDTLINVGLFWTPPVDGLRLGYTYMKPEGIKSRGVMKSWAELTVAPSDVRGLAFAFPQAYWDAAIAGQPASGEIDYPMQTVSAEYTRGAWQFAAEYFWSDLDGTSVNPAPLGRSAVAMKSDAYYGMATWQATDKLQLGAYYSESFANRDDRDGSDVHLVPAHTAYLKDATVAASYSLADWWLVKLEVHALNGTKGITARTNGEATTWKAHWKYVVLKTTVSF